MFGETTNKFRKGSPVLWYAAQAGEEWHWKEKKKSKYVLCKSTKYHKLLDTKND